MNKKMTVDELRNSIIDFLKEHKQASLATCNKDIPRSSPIQYFLGKGMDIYILSAGGSKFDNIRENSNVCVLVNTEYINYRKIKGVQVFGRAITSEQQSSLFEEAKEYCPDDVKIEELKVIKVTPDEIVYLDSIDDGDRTKQILKGDHVILKQEK